MPNSENNIPFIFYASPEGDSVIRVYVEDENTWVTQSAMSEIFDIDVSGVTKHLKSVFDSGEVDEISNVQKMHIANSTKPVKFYSLDVIISVGYRVNSYKATQFRIWASGVLKEYMLKGFAMDDERLKQGNQLFGKDYFDELLERIREIRASEKRLYFKVTEIYQECSYDYDANSSVTRNFYANVQNKLLFAVSGKTAAEIIKMRADHNLPNMGLCTWINQKKGGKITKRDVGTAKNYLTKDEIDELNRLVNMFLDFAENIAKKQKKMSMEDWVSRLDNFIAFNEYEILQNLGQISQKVASDWVVNQYEKFKPIQEIEHKTDFEKVVTDIKTSGSLPKPTRKKKVEHNSDFDKNLKTALNYNPKD